MWVNSQETPGEHQNRWMFIGAIGYTPGHVPTSSPDHWSRRGRACARRARRRAGSRGRRRDGGGPWRTVPEREMGCIPCRYMAVGQNRFGTYHFGIGEFTTHLGMFTGHTLDCYWVGSLDFHFLVEINVFSKPFGEASTATKYCQHWLEMLSDPDLCFSKFYFWPSLRQGSLKDLHFATS